MNATFRRDYAYVTKTDINLDVTGLLEKGTNLRYIKYDARTESYLFVTGNIYHFGEQLIVVGLGELTRMYQSITKTHRCGYEQTDAYAYKLITKPSQLEVGSTYGFTCIGDVYIDSELLKVDRLTDYSEGIYSLIYEDGYGSQSLPKNWLTSGKVVGLLVSKGR